MKPSNARSPTGGQTCLSSPAHSCDSTGSSPSLKEKLMRNSSSSSGIDNNGIHAVGQRNTLKQTVHSYIEWAKKNQGNVIKWTIFDDRRIISLDDLHSRMRDYHVANSPPVTLFPLVNEMLLEREFEVAFHYYRVVSSASAASAIKSVSVGNIHKVLNEELNLSSINGRSHSNNGNGVDLLWIHMTNCSCMSTILNHFHVSHIFQLYFTDERPHSSFISSASELILTLMSCRLGRRGIAQLNKVYIYVRGNLCITFEMDPVPDLDRSMQMSQLTGLGLSRSDSGMVSTDIDINTGNPVLLQSTNADSAYCQRDTVVSNVIDRINSNEVCIANATQLLCELATQNLLIQTSLLDFCSLSIFYFRDKLNRSQFEMVKGDADRKVRVIESCLMMLQSFASDAEDAVRGANLDYAYIVQGIYLFVCSVRPLGERLIIIIICLFFSYSENRRAHNNNNNNDLGNSNEEELLHEVRTSLNDDNTNINNIIATTSDRANDAAHSLSTAASHTDEFNLVILLETLVDFYQSNVNAINSELLEARATYEDMNDKSTVTHNSITVPMMSKLIA